MTRDQWEQLRTLLAVAVEVPEDQRTAAYLEQLCQGDPTLVPELQALLVAHQRPEAAYFDEPMFRFASVPSDVLLITGTRLASYEVLGPLGVGGMGEVYRAHDTTLGRDVALKILPDSFARDPDRLGRFRREAQVLAALNHPHIAAIYGLEVVNRTHFLVLELVDGESLDKRMMRGPIAVTEALRIAQQFAEALEAAHEKGIIHRDLKPPNIALTAAGEVKVLDFGLAKATEPPYGAGADPGNTPTLGSPAVMTSTSLIVGTPAYMAPEQACGKVVDKRADVWAFGVVLYEMVSGRRAFAGDSDAEVLAAVLEHEPDWEALPEAVPPPVRRLLARCLTKDPKMRLRDIGEARVLIDEFLRTRPGSAVTPPSPPARRVRPRVLPWLIAGAALAGGLVLQRTRWVPAHQTVPPDPVRLSIELGADAAIVNANGGAATILSPDGRVMAVAGQKANGAAQLYLRRLTQAQATPLDGTDGAESPFFSPDGQWIAFFANGHLKKIAVTGGPAVTLANTPAPLGGTWGDDDTIAFSPNVGYSPLRRVSSAGGTSTPLTTLAPGEVNQRWPDILPGGKAVLFVSRHGPGLFAEDDIVIQPLPSGPRKVIARGTYPRYVRSGHVLYVHDGTLKAVPFDLVRLAVTGQPVTAIEGVASEPRLGSAQMAVSASGTLVYLPGPSPTSGVPIHWLAHTGTVAPLRTTPTNWTSLAFSPDGRRLALSIVDATQSSIWVHDWARDTLNRLTFDSGNDTKPVWTPDGRRIVFASNQGGALKRNLYWQRADGIGGAQRLTNSPHDQAPASWHPSGKFLAFNEANPAVSTDVVSHDQTNWDLMILPMEGDEPSGWRPGTPTVFLSTPFGEIEPMFSPDGHWIAYHSNESGRVEVYVRPFPGPGGKWPISNGGGIRPIWSRTKPELFYSTLDRRIMVASYAVDGDAFRAEKPRLWSDTQHELRGGMRAFDLHPDGERFALTSTAEITRGAKRDHVTMMFNVFDELRRLAPVTRR